MIGLLYILTVRFLPQTAIFDFIKVVISFFKAPKNYHYLSFLKVLTFRFSLEYLLKKTFKEDFVT